MAAVLRIFHISDLHARGFDSPQGERAGREASRWESVLGEEWRKNLGELRKDGPIDLVAFTGDLADWGHESDYARGIDLLRRTCAELEVPLDRLFVVPGNHDVARNVEAETWSELRRVALEAPDEVSRWMADTTTRPRGIPDGADERVLARTAAFWRAVRDGLGRDLGPSADTHGRLGYRHTLALERFPQPVHVIGLDSAWLAGDADAGKLLLTQDQVQLLTHDRRGRLVEGVRIGLVHHPLSDLASGDRARQILPDCVDLLLRGHQHEPASTTLVQPDRRLHELAAGSMFEGVLSDRYRNACQLIELTIDRPGRPIVVDVRFRAWSTDGGFWHDDASLYRAATRGRLRFTIDPTPPQVHTSPPPSPVKAPTSDPLARYQQMSTVHRGLYSEVRKCKIRETGALCVVKRTREDLVSLEALERLQALRDPHVVAPTRFWRADGFVWEELPYIGGLRLSDAVGQGCGGLSGPVLQELVRDMSGILGLIHGAGVIHRDIHPDNIYMMTTDVVGRGAASRKHEDRHVYGAHRIEEQRRASVVPADMRSPPFSITWYLVDNTFAICDHEASTRPPSSHGIFTAEEQVHGLPSHTSDYYSFGATLYYCILGIEVPSPAQRRLRSTPLRMPRGSHPSIDFDELMSSLLSLEPEQRRLRGVYKQSTITPGFTGLIRSSDRQLLAIDQFESDTHGLGLERAATVVDSLVQAWGDGEIPDLFVPRDPFDGWEDEFMRVGLRRWREHLRELGWG